VIKYEKRRIHDFNITRNQEILNSRKQEEGEGVAYVITVGNQKGGVGKTTTAGMLSYLLADRYRVLAIDFDMQANLTQMLLRSQFDSYQEVPGVMDAIQNGVHRGHNLHSCTHFEGRRLDIFPARDDVALFTADNPNQYLALARLIGTIKSDYDFIIIDTPPSLGSHLLTALMASDGAILMAMTHPFAVDAAVRFTNNLEQITAYNHSLEMLGVVITMFEKTAFNKQIEAQIREAYGQKVFQTTLHKRAALIKMSLFGIEGKPPGLNKKQLIAYEKVANEAIEMYSKLAEEVIERARKSNK
jgi:chromosome partitioning protein